MTRTTEQPNPLLALVRSRKVIVAIVGTAINLIIALLPPDIAPRIVALREELINAVTLIALAIIGGIAVEDHGKNSAPTTLNIPTAGDTNVTTPAPPSDAPR